MLLIFYGFVIYQFLKLPVIAGETTTTPSPSAKPAPILSAQEKTELQTLISKYNYTKIYDFSAKTEKQIREDTSLLTMSDNQKLFVAYNKYLVNNGMGVNGDLSKDAIQELTKLTK